MVNPDPLQHVAMHMRRVCSGGAMLHLRSSAGENIEAFCVKYLHPEKASAFGARAFLAIVLRHSMKTYVIFSLLTWLLFLNRSSVHTSLAPTPLLSMLAYALARAFLAIVLLHSMKTCWVTVDSGLGPGRVSELRSTSKAPNRLQRVLGLE